MSGIPVMPLVAGLSVVGVMLAAAGSAAAEPGSTRLVSVSSAGVQGDQDSQRPSLSADGRYVAFASLATNLVPGDTNDSSDVFVHDRRTGVTERISQAPGGADANGQSLFTPLLSFDGRFVHYGL